MHYARTCSRLLSGPRRLQVMWMMPLHTHWMMGSIQRSFQMQAVIHLLCQGSQDMMGLFRVRVTQQEGCQLKVLVDTATTSNGAGPRMLQPGRTAIALEQATAAVTPSRPSGSAPCMWWPSVAVPAGMFPSVLVARMRLLPDPLGKVLRRLPLKTPSGVMLHSAPPGCMGQRLSTVTPPALGVSMAALIQKGGAHRVQPWTAETTYGL